jgi:co-chaperonin GroES (HSP10)
MSNIGIHVKGRRVLVLPDEIEETTEGGIIIAQDKKLERSGIMKGTVVSIGHLAWKDFTDETSWAEIGDWVLYAPYSGQRIKDPITKQFYVVMNDEDVIGTLTRSPE